MTLYSASVLPLPSSAASAGELLYVGLNTPAVASEIKIIESVLEKTNQGPPPKKPPDHLSTITSSGGKSLKKIASYLKGLKSKKPPAQFLGMVISGHSTGDDFLVEGNLGGKHAFSSTQLADVIDRTPLAIRPNGIYLMGCYSLSPRQVSKWQSIQDEGGLMFTLGFSNQAPSCSVEVNSEILKKVTAKMTTLEERKSNTKIDRRTKSTPAPLKPEVTIQDLDQWIKSLEQLYHDNSIAGCTTDSYFDFNYRSGEKDNPAALTCNPQRKERVLTAINLYQRYCSKIIAFNETQLRTAYNHFQYSIQCLTEAEQSKAPTAIQFVEVVHDSRTGCPHTRKKS